MNCSICGKGIEPTDRIRKTVTIPTFIKRAQETAATWRVEQATFWGRSSADNRPALSVEHFSCVVKR